jgi:phosphatidylinositol alpha-1,6-mannosyltransferase
LTGKFSLWQGWALKKIGWRIPQIAILHGSEVNLSNLFLRKFTHWSISTADQIVAVSKFTRSLLPHWILSHREVVIIPNGIEANVEEGDSRGIELEGNPKLITVGHISPRKGQHRVIKALPILIKKFPNLRYHIIGRAVNQLYVEDIALKLGVRDSITFHGRIKDHSDLKGYYRAADVFMLLSENQANGDVEGFGIVALEANLNGLPVIGAKFCGVEDAVSQGNSGYLVDGNNVEEIAQAVEKVIESREILTPLAKQWAQIHEWRIIVKQYTRLIS